MSRWPGARGGSQHGVVRVRAGAAQGHPAHAAAGRGGAARPAWAWVPSAGPFRAAGVWQLEVKFP